MPRIVKHDARRVRRLYPARVDGPRRPGPPRVSLEPAHPALHRLEHAPGCVVSPARIAVIGAGPAGSAAAFHLASAGLDTTLIEARPFPRAKVCGEFVSPAATGLLEAIVPPGDHRARARRTGTKVRSANGGSPCPFQPRLVAQPPSGSTISCGRARARARAQPAGRRGRHGRADAPHATIRPPGRRLPAEIVVTPTATPILPA